MKKPAKLTKHKPSAAPKKSKGDSLETIYDELHKILLRHVPPFKRGNLSVRNKKSLDLVVPKPVAVPGAYGGKPVDLQFAAIILQKGYVGFYLMGVYANPKAKGKISPALLKLLKGKSCFHVKSLDEGLKKDIEAALDFATDMYSERGWL